MASLFLHGSRLLTFLSIQTLLLLCTTLAGDQSVPATYSFGDSIVDVGMNNDLPFSAERANFLPNGIDNQGQNPTGRFSNGKCAADFFAEKLGLPTAPPYRSQPNGAFVNGTSFASGGAGILTVTGLNIFKQTFPLAQQSEFFSIVRQRIVKELLSDSAAQQHLSKSLFIVEIGSNDIIGYFSNQSAVSKIFTTQQYVDLMASTLNNTIKGIYNMGARKFAVLGVPPVGCTPKQRDRTGGEQCFEAMNTVCRNFNVKLLQLLPELKSRLPGFQYTYLDTYNAIGDIIQNSTTYGFRDVTSACCRQTPTRRLPAVFPLPGDIPCAPGYLVCSNRSEYFFWDFYHPTDAAAQAFVGLLLNGTTKYATPITFQQLIAM